MSAEAVRSMLRVLLDRSVELREPGCSTGMAQYAVGMEAACIEIERALGVEETTLTQAEEALLRAGVRFESAKMYGGVRRAEREVVEAAKAYRRARREVCLADATRARMPEQTAGNSAERDGAAARKSSEVGSFSVGRSTGSGR